MLNSDDPLKALMREFALKALEPLVAAIERHVAYKGRIELHFVDLPSLDSTGKHQFQTLNVDIPLRHGMAASFPTAGSDIWHLIGMGMCDAIATRTLYRGRVVARFIDENCDGPRCSHGPADFCMELVVASDRAPGTSPLLMAGMYPQHRHDADGNCIGPDYLSVLD